MTPETALRLYFVSHTEQEAIWHNDLLNLRLAFPSLEPVLMELQFRRTETERLELECERLEMERDELRAAEWEDD